MANFLSWLFGDSDDSTDAAERMLERTASPVAIVQKAAPVVGRAVQNDAAEAFLRGLDFLGGRRGMAEPYKRSGWVQRAIKLVADPITAVPLCFATPTSEGAKQIQDPELAAYWETPAIGPEGPLTRAAVLQSTVGWLKLAGEAFWVFDDEWLLPRGGRNPFFIARPDAMKEILSQDGGTLLGWKFRDASGKDWPLLPEQVYHPKFWNPYHPVRGLPEYIAAATAAESDVAAGEFVKNLMQSNGDRGPIIGLKEGTRPLSKPQQDQIEAAIKEKMAQARAGVLKPLFLSGEVTVSNPDVQKPDSDYVACRVENRKEIYMIFGVPSSFAEQMHRATTAHESDRYILIEQTCMPLATMLAGTIAQVSRDLKRLRGDGARKLLAYFDWDEHSVMLQIRSERVETWGKLCNRGMPPADAGKYLAMRLPSFPGDDKGIVPLAVQTLEEALAEPADPPTPDPEPPEDGKDPAAEKMLALLSVPSPGSPLALLSRPGILDAPAAPPVVKAGPPEPTAATLARAASDGAREKLWRKHAKVRTPTEKQFRRVVKKALWNARGQVLAKVERTGQRAIPGTVQRDDDDKPPTPPAAPHPGTALDIMFDPVTFGLELSNGVERVARVAMQQAGEEVRAEMGVDDPWTMEASDVFNALRQRENLIKQSGQEIFDDIRGELEKGFQAGESTAQIAARVRSAFNDISKGRAQTIAVTETGAAYGGGREAGAASIGYKTKSWLSARDTHVRPTHTEADGQTVAAAGLFKVGGESTPYPCGEGLSAKEACGCRCVTLYHP